MNNDLPSSKLELKYSKSEGNDRRERRGSDASMMNVSQRVKIDDNSDPLKNLTPIDSQSVKSETLILRTSDELRVAAAMADAAKKKKTGSLFSLRVEIPPGGTLGLGVKNLKDSILAVSMLKRKNGILGPAESAGIRLGDIMIGVNYKPCKEGAKTLLQTLTLQIENSATEIYFQCWRCHQLCSDTPPGYLFPKGDDVFVLCHSLYRNKVLISWERWNFIEIILGYLQEEIQLRVAESLNNYLTPNPRVRVIQNQILDVERNILQAKCLRPALCVRIVYTKFFADAVLYVVMVEDVESGLQWNIRKRYRDFFALQDTLSKMSQYTKDIAFPKKQIVQLRLSTRVIEERIAALEQYMRHAVHRLTVFATSDPNASLSLRYLQEFLGVSNYMDYLHPPRLDDQRCLELIVYRHLNDLSSTSCMQCIRFVETVELDSLVLPGSEGYTPVLELIKQALAEVESFALEQYGPHLSQILMDRRPNSSKEKIRVFVRRCVRRQVEAALFLPLRKNIFRIVYSFVAAQAQKLQDCMKLLKTASPEIFMVSPYVDVAKKLPIAVKAFRDMVEAYLPADQGQLLMRAAAAVMELYSECAIASTTQMETKTKPVKESTKPTSTEGRASITQSQQGKRASFVSSRPQSMTLISNFLNKEVLADPAGTIFSTDDDNTLNARGFLEDEYNHEEVILSNLTNNNSEPLMPLIDNVDEKETYDVDEATSHRSTIRAWNTDAVRSLKEEELLNSLISTPKYNEGNESNNAFHDAVNETNRLLADDTRSVVTKGELFSASETTQLTQNQRYSARLSTSATRIDVVDSPLSMINRQAITDVDVGVEDDISQSMNGALSKHLNDAYSAAAAGHEDDDSEYNKSSSNSNSKPRLTQACAPGGFYENVNHDTVVSADDFLPMFTYVLVQTEFPQMLLVKVLMSTLVDDEEMFGECGYYMATLEAATQHIVNLAADYKLVCDKASTDGNICRSLSLESS